MVAGVGMSSSCFFLAAVLCGLYRFFALPLPSSFHLAGRRAMGEILRVGLTGTLKQSSVRDCTKKASVVDRATLQCNTRRPPDLSGWYRQHILAHRLTVRLCTSCPRWRQAQGAHAAGLRGRLCRLPAGEPLWCDCMLVGGAAGCVACPSWRPM